MSGGVPSRKAKATPLTDAMTRLRESPLPAWMFRD